MCGSTPVITSGIPPSLMNVNETNSSSPNDSNSSVCQHHQKLENIQCCCKVATRQNAAAHTPLNPHHDAQHLQNHMCNDAANCRWLILMNPINALHISVTLGAKGRIFRTDDSLAAILGYDCTNRLFGMEIHRLIPELRTDLDMSSKPQQCCGCSIKVCMTSHIKIITLFQRNGVPFTAIVVVELDKDQNPMAFNVQLRSLSSINGVVTVTDAGIVYSYNENFLYALVGRDLDKKDEVIVSLLIPPGPFLHNSKRFSWSPTWSRASTRLRRLPRLMLNNAHHPELVNRSLMGCPELKSPKILLMSVAEPRAVQTPFPPFKLEHFMAWPSTGTVYMSPFDSTLQS